MNHSNPSQFCGNVRRREFLTTVGGGFTHLALCGMLARDGFFGTTAQAAAASAASSAPRLAAKAKSVIFLFMYGGPSHIDTFDYKPSMIGMDGKTIQIQTKGRGGSKNQGRIVEPKWKFKQYGQSGKWVSDLFPHLAQRVDDLAFVHSMTAESPIHGSAMLKMNTGSIVSGKPSLGSWINYGLGSVNQNLPGYVVMLDKTGGPISGAKNWTSGFMPATYQGTVFRSKGAPILDLSPREGMSDAQQRLLIQSLNELNRSHLSARADNTQLSARIESYELAYRMQAAAPEAIEIDKESPETRALYGLDNPRTEDFGRKCLMARRLVERGVRFIQLYSGGAHTDDNWDAHGDLVKNHEYHAGNTDRPIAGLLQDLKQRGLLDETLVVWGGEFGRQPTAEYASGTGRDHNSAGFTMWLAGGGIKGGVSYGETDELGNRAVTNRCEVKDLHATILHLLGVDPNQLSFFYGGLDQKLVGVEGADPISAILA
ncbi:MAG: hypothetical protein RLZZ399_637 [Verrucomicrobiota bacterium]|jgi:hypothetical protein